MRLGRKYPQAECPKCGATSSDLRHGMLSKWHECKRCKHRFSATCAPYRHGYPTGVVM